MATANIILVWIALAIAVGFYGTHLVGAPRRGHRAKGPTTLWFGRGAPDGYLTPHRQAAT